MKISQKLIRRIFLLLSPFLLSFTMGECSFFEYLWLIECPAPLEVGELNSTGTRPDLSPINVGDNGVIYIPDGPCSQNYILATVNGNPDLNGVTFLPHETVGNIIVGDGGTIVQFDLNNQIISIFNPAGTQNLNAIEQDLNYVSSVLTLIAVGNSGTVIKSTDHGLNWSVVNFPFSTDLKVCHLDGDYITVGGNDYSAYQSYDCGDTWEQIGLGENFNSVGPTSFNAIFFYDENVGYMGGPWGLMGKTTDGGTNWTTFGVLDFEEITDLFFSSPDSGVVVGKPGMVRFTADGGNTWQEDTMITNFVGGRNIKQIGVFNENIGSVLIDGGVTIAFATDSSLLTAVNEDEIHIHNYSLSNNYPNPFNPSTIIEYSLPQYGFVTLRIYDMLGREIATLVNEEKPAGNYKFEFEASNLASGVYYYHITVGNEFVETRKMILLK